MGCDEPRSLRKRGFFTDGPDAHDGQRVDRGSIPVPQPTQRFLLLVRRRTYPHELHRVLLFVVLNPLPQSTHLRCLRTALPTRHPSQRGLPMRLLAGSPQGHIRAEGVSAERSARRDASRACCTFRVASRQLAHNGIPFRLVTVLSQSRQVRVFLVGSIPGFYTNKWGGSNGALWMWRGWYL